MDINDMNALKLDAIRLITEGHFTRAAQILESLTFEEGQLTPMEQGLWRDGYKIDAIKAYRTRVVGAGLKETKDLFERVLGQPLVPTRFFSVGSRKPRQ